MPIKTSLVNILNNPNKSFIQASIIEPNKNQTEKAGTLFILTEINQPNKIAEKIIFIISQLLEKNYYLNEKIFLAEQLNSLKIEAIFESALVKSNRELLEFIDQQKISFNFKTLNIIVGLIYEEQIHFSSMGQNKSFLINKNDDNWQISDINPSDEEHEIEDLAAGKIFSSIISGELPENSYIIFSNPSLSQYLLGDEFVKIIGELKLEGATEQIKNYLKKINNYSNFCGLLIKNSFSSLSNNNIKYYDSDLINTENKTEKLLTTPGSINTKKTIKKISLFLNKINIFKGLPKTIRKLFKKANTKKEKSIEITEHSSSNKRRINKKNLLIIAGILLLILVANIVFQKKEKSEVLIEENASNFSELIEQKQNQIDSALLYNNEARAKEIIEELQEIINSLSDKEKNKIKNYSEIEEKISEQISKIQKMIKLSNPREITNFSNLSQEADTMAMEYRNESGKIYAVDGKNNHIYLLNLEGNVSSILSKNDSISGDYAISANFQDNSYFIVGDQVITINGQDQISFNKINLEDKESISSFDVYNSRPYIVNKKQNQIIRYNRSGDTFSSPTNWLKDNSNINIQSIAIDYSIYILTQEGEVKKYLEGSPENFSTDKITPPLEKADYLKIGDKYIFVVDKSSQRIVVFYKENGLFINQYYSDKFDNIKDMAIDEKNNKIYILNNNSVYEVDIIL